MAGELWTVSSVVFQKDESERCTDAVQGVDADCVSVLDVGGIERFLLDTIDAGVCAVWGGGGGEDFIAI